MGKLYNLARMTTATTGTGTITLGAAVSPYLTFALAGVANADIVSYGIKDGANSEIGTGTYTTAGTTLTRTVTKSTNANAAISLSGTAEVFITPRAEDLITPALVRSYLAGLTLSTAGASATFGIAAGVATDSTNVSMMTLASAYTKTTSAWALGTAAGSLDTGVIANSTWYHAYQIQRPDTGVVDVLISSNATTPTLLPTNYTLYRRIGSMKTNGSAQWTKFIQDGDTFQWDVAVVDVNGAVNPGTAAVTRTLSTPLGVRVQAFVNVNALLSTTAAVDNPAAVILSDLSISDQAPSVTSVLSFINYSGGTQVGGTGYVTTNTSSQIRSRLAQSTANTSLYITTQAWVDRRGRDS